MNGRNNRRIMNQGISLFLVLLIIMCLLSFASLSLSSSLADRRLSNKYAAFVTDYYQAHNQGQTCLQSLCMAAASSDPALPAPAPAAAEASGTMTSPASIAYAAIVSPDGLVTARFPAGENLELVLTMEPVTDADGRATYHVLSEKTESAADLDYDDSLSVIKSGEEPEEILR